MDTRKASPCGIRQDMLQWGCQIADRNLNCSAAEAAGTAPDRTESAESLHPLTSEKYIRTLRKQDAPPVYPCFPIRRKTIRWPMSRYDERKACHKTSAARQGFTEEGTDRRTGPVSEKQRNRTGKAGSFSRTIPFFG